MIRLRDCIYVTILVTAIVHAVRKAYLYLSLARERQIMIHEHLTMSEYMVAYKCIRLSVNPHNGMFVIAHYWYMWSETSSNNRDDAVRKLNHIRKRIPEITENTTIIKKSSDRYANGVVGIMQSTPDVIPDVRNRLMIISNEFLIEKCAKCTTSHVDTNA